MKISRMLPILWICCVFNVTAQTDAVFRSYAHTSDLIPKGNFRYSLFSNMEYGLTDNVTIEAHPIWMFLSPSVEVKWGILNKNGKAFSIYHGIACPTPILSIVSREGTGGFISPEFRIPFMLSVRNGIVSTHNLAPKQRVTYECGFEIALFNDELEPGSSIDLPIISPRNAVYYKNAGFNLALGLEGKIRGKFDYFSKAEVFLFPFNDQEYELEYDNSNMYFGEMTGLAFWNITQKFKLGIGGRLSYGDYPFGTQWHLLPMLDFVKYAVKN